MTDSCKQTTKTNEADTESRRRDEDEVAVLISVVAVAWNNANYIRKALTSVFSQAGPEIELIYVDNGSDDGTLEIAQEVRRKYSECRATIVANERNRGLGIARNQGLEVARGEYIMFLDGDDWYAEDTLSQVKREIRRAAPDLIVFNHARFYPSGRSAKNLRTDMLEHPEPSSKEGREGLIQNLNVAWNKVYRHDFIRGNQLRFGEGFYEDIDWNFRALLLANEIATIPEVLIHYRQRDGSILRSTDPRHFDVFDQWKKVIDFLRSDPSLAATYGNAVQRYAYRQVTSVLDNKERIPPSLKRDFFTQMSSLWKAFESIGTKISQGGHRKIDYLIRNDYYAVYRVFRLYIDNFQSRVPKRITRAHDDLKLAAYHHVMLRAPINPKRVLFDSYWSKKMDCNPYYIFQQMQKTHPDYEAYWSLHHDAPRRDGAGNYIRIAPKSWRYYWVIATSQYFISNVNFPTEIVKRPGTIHVQTKHGTPLKFMGLDLRETRPRSMNWAALAKRSARWDYVISSNRYSTEVWRDAFPYSYRVLEIGYPRNDILFNISDEKLRKIKEQLEIPLDKKIALYAPTFRDWIPNKNQSSYMQRIFDPASVVEALGEDYVLLLRTHYFATNPAAINHPRIVEVSTYIDTNELCALTDLLISDYSSIIFDFAVLKRPIVLYVPDFEQYSEERGMYFDIRETPPGPVAEGQEELLALLREQAWKQGPAKQHAEDFRERFCAFDDGRASERAVSAIFKPS